MSYQKILEAIPTSEILKYIKKHTSQSVGSGKVGASATSRKALLQKQYEIKVKQK